LSFNNTIPGLGCTVSYATTSGGSYTSVGQLKSIGGLSVETSMVESSGLGSDAAEQVPSLFKGGDFPFSTWFNPANTTHAALVGYIKSKTLLYWKLTFPNPVGPGATVPGSAIVYSFAGYCNKASLSGFEIESEVECEFNVAITGDVTFGS
jgi:hypothetical protein